MLKRPMILACSIVVGLPLTSAGASAQNIDRYCKANLGPESRAVMLDRSDAYSWRCSAAGGLVDVVVNDLCRQQFGRGRAIALHRGDAYSWRCVR